MHPSSRESGETPGISLPPVSEQPPAPAAGEARPETVGVPAGPERAQSPPASIPPTTQPIIPLPTAPSTPASSGQNDAGTTSKSKSGGLVKDDDLIEKEWVDRAKRIVEQTRNDPRQQSDQLTGVKVEYMKKHYNKTIKISK
jgi:hypothetical protein